MLIHLQLHVLQSLLGTTLNNINFNIKLQTLAAVTVYKINVKRKFPTTKVPWLLSLYVIQSMIILSTDKTGSSHNKVAVDRAKQKERTFRDSENQYLRPCLTNRENMVHTHAHTHIYTHTRSLSLSHTFTHSHSHTHTHTHIHSHIHTHTLSEYLGEKGGGGYTIISNIGSLIMCTKLVSGLFS